MSRALGSDPWIGRWVTGSRIPNCHRKSILRSCKRQWRGGLRSQGGAHRGVRGALQGPAHGERYQGGLDYWAPLPSRSMGKSITATLMGRLIQEGVYDLWQPAAVEE